MVGISKDWLALLTMPDFRKKTSGAAMRLPFSTGESWAGDT
jgi:hypothetical protein